MCWYLCTNRFWPTALSFSIEDVFALHTWQSPLFKPWQFITHLFMHGSIGPYFLQHVALWMFGSILENVWGPKTFSYFLFCVRTWCGIMPHDGFVL